MPHDLAGEAQVLRWSVAALNTIEVPVLSLWFVNSNGGKDRRGKWAAGKEGANWTKQRIRVDLQFRRIFG
jgi:glutathione S-transferase